MVCLCDVSACFCVYRLYLRASVCVQAPMCLCVGMCKHLGGTYASWLCEHVSAYVLVAVEARTAPGLYGGVCLGALMRWFGQRVGMGECQEGRRGCGQAEPCWGPAEPCQPWGSFLAALSQALRVPGSAALPLPLWALRRRPLWNVFGGRGPGWAQFHQQAGQREGGTSVLPPHAQLHALLSPRLGDSFTGHAVVS